MDEMYRVQLANYHYGTETMEHLMLECERYHYARTTKMLEVVAEEIRVQEWSEMREREEC